ncbi:universal stress protein [Streptomyces sp. NPDC097981]|uniref:universal stress protein n=1 Tax=Streptomyces sp. NPDC097981 TaxID=3155428 RepID=UPI00332BB973
MPHPLPTPLSGLGPRSPSRTVTVGFDGSAESLAAVAWAADEARRRGLPLRLLHVWGVEPDVHALPAGPGVRHHHSAADPRTTAERVRRTHPDLEVVTRERCGERAAVLCEAAGEADLLVLGSRRPGGLTGLVVGSVAWAVVARTRHPVVLAGGPEPMPEGDVVLGLDLSHPCDEVLEFAFSQACRLGAPLRVIHSPRPSGGCGPDAAEAAAAMAPGAAAAATARTLARVIDQWRHAFPGLRVTGEIRPGHPGRHLLEASRAAVLVVIGRRNRDSRLGPHAGAVTRTMLHRCRTPMAVVPHE